MNGQTIDSALAPEEQRTGMMLAHLLGVLFGVLGALIYWLVTKDKNDQPFVQDQAKEALNFQLNVMILAMLCGALIVIIIGMFLLPVLILGALVFGIIATINAYGGTSYRYPLIIRLIK